MWINSLDNFAKFEFFTFNSFVEKRLCQMSRQTHRDLTMVPFLTFKYGTLKIAKNGK